MALNKIKEWQQILDSQLLNNILENIPGCFFSCVTNFNFSFSKREMRSSKKSKV